VVLVTSGPAGSLGGGGIPAAKSVPSVLELEGIGKAYTPGRLVLRDVDLTLRRSEIHGVVGQNGAGKSTLMKIVTGLHRPTAGRMHIRGEQVVQFTPAALHERGVRWVHQDVGVARQLNLIDNVCAGRYPARTLGVLRYGAERPRVEALLTLVGLRRSVHQMAGDLTAGERVLLAMARALYQRDDDEAISLLVLDEVTSALPRAESEAVLRAVRQAGRSGVAVLFVSHRIDEVHELCDRTTVLRDGAVVGQLDRAENSVDSLVALMIGGTGFVPSRRPMTPAAGSQAPNPEPVLRVQGLRGGALVDLDLTVAAEEIVGLIGPVGSGFEDVPYLLLGAGPPERAGLLATRAGLYDVAGLSPDRAASAGLTLVPGDRVRQGSAPSLSVSDNVSISMLGRFYRRGRLRRSEEEQFVSGLLASANVQPNNPRETFRRLSGGNQQKAIVANRVGRDADVLMLHEPTIGVDTLSRSHLAMLVREYAAGGRAVLVASIDGQFLLDVCDRIVFFANGRAVREQATQEITSVQALLNEVFDPAGAE
jgi:ribose transport system ATP-binding protein